MAELNTIHIKYVRSGIGFDYHTKQMIRSLGLTRLNQVVERQDTPQIRGQVAKIPHFVEIVDPKPAPAWHSVPEYVIHPPEPKPAREVEVATAAVEETSAPVEPVGEAPEAAETAPPKEVKQREEDEEHAQKAAPAPASKKEKAAKRHAEPAKRAAQATKGKGKTAKAEEPRRSAKPAKPRKSEKKGKK